jgi:cysteinyl-tRNA synthetase
VREANRRQPGTVGEADLREMLEMLGLEGLLEPAPEPIPDAQARALVSEREGARSAGDFATADGLRERLAELGWEVRDGPSGPELRRP